jgi:hypothetical protein
VLRDFLEATEPARMEDAEWGAQLALHAARRPLRRITA